MHVADSNVLVFAFNTAAPEHERCRGLLERWTSEPTPWYLTWGIVYEFLRVATHRVFARPADPAVAWTFVDTLLSAPSTSILVPAGRHRAVLAQSLAEAPGTRGNLVHDLHTAVLMREHGVTRIVTRDADFRRFPWIEVIDPLA